MEKIIGRVLIQDSIRFVTPVQGLEDQLALVSGDFDNGFFKTGELVASKELKYIMPFESEKLIGIGKNYPSADEKPDEVISFFLMAKNALLPHNENLILSNRIGSLIPEGELGVVIGKTLKSASLKEAAKSILGYTICNDFSARDTNPPESNAAIRKSSDGLLPMGPYVFLTPELRDFEIKTYCNGELIQSGNTNKMIHKIPEMISYISDFITLNRFDVISTGTPGPKFEVKRGSSIRVVIEDIGILENKIV